MYSSGNSNQPIIVLKEGTERSKDKEAQFNNIAAAKAVADSVRSTLGPKGMDKMLVDSIGDVTVTNDGVTILKEIDVQHPAAKMVVEVAKTQDTECGDGTTTAVVLAGELLKQSESLIDSNIHPTVITNGFKLAAEKAVEVLNDIAVPSNDDKLLKKVAETAMTGKSVGGEGEHLADLIVQAARDVQEGNIVDTTNIKIEKKAGGVINDTYLVKGLVIDKQRVHPRMPKVVKNAKIALFTTALENKKPEVSAEISISDPLSMQSFLNEEDSTLKAIVDKIVSTGANVVFCQKGVDDLVQHYLAKAGVLCFRRLKESDIIAISKATGGSLVGEPMEIQAKDLGTAEEVAEKEVGLESMCFITGCKNPKAVSIVIRGGTEHVLAEVERAMVDAIRVVGVAIEAFSKALEIIPWTIAENAGIDSIDAIIKLKTAHDKKKKNGAYFGLDLDTGEAVNMLDRCVVEPLRVKVQAINSAAEVANMILRIDDVIASRRAPPMNPMADPSMGGPGMSGVGGMM